MENNLPEVFKNKSVLDFLFTNDVPNLKELLDLFDASSKSVDNFGNIYTNIDEKISIAKKVKLIIDVRQKELESQLKEVKSKCSSVMLSEGLSNSEGVELFDMSVRKSNPSLVIDEESLIPEEYYTEKVLIEKVINKELIRALLKSGKSIPGCRLEQGVSLTVKAKGE